MKLRSIIFPLCFIVLNAFGFEGTVRQVVNNYNGTGNNVTATWYLGAHGCRVDIAMTGKDVNSNSVLLLDAATQTLKAFETGGSAQKVYFKLSASDISGNPAVSVSPTQETKQINGYKCEKWIVTTTGGAYNVWITREIDFDWSGYRNFFKTSAEIQALAMQGVKGFPILTESSNGNKVASVESVTPQTLAPVAFAVPSGYTLFVSPPQPAAKAK